MKNIKTQILTTLVCLLVAMPVAARKINFHNILQGAKEAEASAKPTARVLSGISAEMKKAKAQEDVAMSTTLSGIAASMKENPGDSRSEEVSYYAPEISYSTYGYDAREDIARSAEEAYNNPFIMGDYSAGTTFAVPAGSRYINTTYSKVLPVPGMLTSDYGFRPAFGRMHHGVDLALNVGDTVRSALDGTVVLISNDPRGYGRYVKIKHDGGLETIYGHLTSPAVRHGERVRAGQPIGLGGDTGNATGPHLHFETRLNGVAVNPSNYFRFPTQLDRNVPQLQTQRKKNRNASPANVKAVSVPSETVTTVAAQNKAVKQRTGSYQVKRGETLEKIARDHGMSVGEICRLNKMSPKTPMYVGKVIRLK